VQVGQAPKEALADSANLGNAKAANKQQGQTKKEL